MKCTLRAGLLGFVAAAAIFISGALLLSVHFVNAKNQTRFLSDHQLSSTLRSAAYIDAQVTLAQVISPAQVRTSKELIFLVEEPCRKETSTVVSDRFLPQLSELKINPAQWAQSLEVFQKCSARSEMISIIPSRAEIAIPYLMVLFVNESSSRLVMLSAEAYRIATWGGLALHGVKGEMLWSLGELAATQPTISGQQAWQDGDFVFASALTSQGWKLVSHSSLSRGITANGFMPRLTSIAVAAIVCCLALVLLALALALRRWFDGPLAQISAYLAALKSGDRNATLTVQAPREMAGLAEAVQGSVAAFVARIAELEDANMKLEAKALSLQRAPRVESQSKQAPPATAPVIEADAPRIVKASPGIHVFNHTKNGPKIMADWWVFIEIPRVGKAPISLLTLGDVTGDQGTDTEVAQVKELVPSMILESVRAHAEAGRDPRVILESLNRQVFELTSGVVATSCFVGSMDPADGLLRCSNAGHPLPYLLVRDHTTEAVQIRTVSQGGVPAGMLPDSKYTELDSYRWSRDCQLFLYTDGFIGGAGENEVAFDRRKMRRALQDLSVLKGRHLLDGIVEQRRKVSDYAAGDDVTAIVCEANFEI